MNIARVILASMVLPEAEWDKEAKGPVVLLRTGGGRCAPVDPEIDSFPLTP
jgi:hypothetical protein